VADVTMIVRHRSAGALQLPPTLCIRKAESFGPLAFNFIKNHSFLDEGLAPDEQFDLLMATTDAFADEPKS
jgi:hypothetical protein